MQNVQKYKLYISVCQADNICGISFIEINRSSRLGMNRIDELRIKRRGSLLVVSTLGLAAVFSESARPAWMQNIFAGTSMDTGGVGFVLKLLSFIILAGLTAAIFFVIHFIRLVFCQLEIWYLSGEPQSPSRRKHYDAGEATECGSDCRNAHTGDSESVPAMSYREDDVRCYFLRDGHTVYGPYSLDELNIVGYNHNTLIAVDEPSDWHTAAEIFG